MLHLFFQPSTAFIPPHRWLCLFSLCEVISSLSCMAAYLDCCQFMWITLKFKHKDTVYVMRVIWIFALFALCTRRTVRQDKTIFLSLATAQFFAVTRTRKSIEGLKFGKQNRLSVLNHKAKALCNAAQDRLIESLVAFGFSACLKL